MESGVLDKGDIQKMQGRGSSRTGLGSTDLGASESFTVCVTTFPNLVNNMRPDINTTDATLRADGFTVIKPHDSSVTDS